MAVQRDASSRFPYPPFVLSALIAAGFFARWLWPWPFLPGGWLRIAAGLIVMAGGLAVALAAERAFKAARTHVRPDKPTTAIVSTGVFGYSRNPMYLGMAFLLGGLGIAANALWFWLAVPILMAALLKQAIWPEEAYLEHKFGQDYLNYKAKVRRWI